MREGQNIGAGLGGGRGLLSPFNGFDFDQVRREQIELAHEKDTPSLQYHSAPGTGGRIYGDGASIARLRYTRAKHRRSEKDGERRDRRVYREPQEARGTHPER